MFDTSADLYDAIYGSFKDYAAEAATVAAAIRHHAPTAQTVLDVACGTGEHARQLHTEFGFAVDGIDIESRFVELARAKHPTGRFVQADMADFDLGHPYDAVLCLFSSIGYMRDADRLGHAIRAMARHVASGGVLIVEPWFTPGAMEDGRVSCVTARTDDLTVCRMSRTTIHDRVSRIEFEYLIGSRDGLRRAAEMHELGLFTRDQMVGAFHDAGLAVEYDEAGLTGRGLYVARPAVWS